MVVFVLVIALLNVGLGFGLAVYFGRLPAMVPVMAAPDVEGTVPVCAAERPVVERAPRRPLDEPLEKPPVEEIPEQWLELLDDTVEVNSFAEASVQVLKLEVGKYRELLLQIEQRVRRYMVDPGSDPLGAILEELKLVNEDWLGRQAEAAGHLRDRQGQMGGFNEMGAALEAVLEEQAAQIETMVTNIDVLDFETDRVMGNRRLIGEIGKLVSLAHSLRDRMHESLLAIVRDENRLETLDKRLQIDGATGILNRSGIEAVFWEWWRDDPNRIRQLSVAMVDIDRLGEINETYGTRTGDALISAFAQAFDELVRKNRGHDVLSRTAGQRFLVFLGDTGPRNATSAIERMRQTIEKTSFLQEDESELVLTVSCGVTEVGDDDTTVSTFERLGKCLWQAKKHGRNCTFLDEGEGPKIVEPPQFDVKGRIVCMRD